MLKHFFLSLLILSSTLAYSEEQEEKHLSIFTPAEQVLFQKHRYKLLFQSLKENKLENDGRYFYTGYRLYQSGKYQEAFSYFKQIKDEEFADFSNYYMGRYFFNRSRLKEAVMHFEKIKGKHYFNHTLLLHRARIYMKNMDLKSFEVVHHDLFENSKKKQKKEIQKNYIQLLYKLYVKARKYQGKKAKKGGGKEETLLLKKKLKKEILAYLDLDSRANSPWLKPYIKKIFRTENDYLQLLLKRYYYTINKFHYHKGLQTIDADLRRYWKYYYKSKSRKVKTRRFAYVKRLYLLKIELLYKLRNYRKTFPIFEKILKYRDASIDYWFFKVLYKRNMLKRFDRYYEKYHQVFSKSEWIEEIDYLRARLHFNNHTEDAEKLFESFFKKYVISQHIDEMKEKLAWLYYRQGHYSKAISLYEDMVKSQDEKKRDLALYWLGRIYKNAGLKHLTKKYWRQILEHSPVSYYSNLVLNQSDDYFHSFLAHNRSNVNHNINIRNFDKIIHDKTIPRYIRFFIKYRMHSLARFELFYLYKKNKRKIKHPLKLALAKLFENNEQVKKFSHAIFHHDMGGALAPEEDAFEIWTLAYPNKFQNDVRFASKKLKVSKSLIYAIMREESSFNRLAKSYSNAYGLMQLIYPTARRMRFELRKKTRLNFNRSWKLFNARYNIGLGTTYLHLLAKKFDGNLISMIASYNAGERNTERWRKRLKGLDEDEFVESIPINQTKNYVKKVLKSYYAYDYLYGDGDKTYIPLNNKKKKKVRKRRRKRSKKYKIKNRTKKLRRN